MKSCVLVSKQSVLAGMRIQPAHGDPRAKHAEFAHGLVAQLDGVEDAFRIDMAGGGEIDVRGHMNGGKFFAPQQHARFFRMTKFRDVFRVSGKRAAFALQRFLNRFLIDGCGDHGCGFTAQAKFGGDPHVLQCRATAARVAPAGHIPSKLAQRAGIVETRVGEVKAGDSLGLARGRCIAHHYPARQWREFRIGQGFQHDLRANAGGIAHG